MRSKKSLVVSNAGPLIRLAKTHSLHLFQDVHHEVVIPQEVKNETVDRGIGKGLPDAIQISDAINEGWTKVKDIKLTQEFTNMAQIAGLKTAEAAVICYA